MGAGVTCHSQAICSREPKVSHDEIRLLPIDQRHRLRAGVGPKGHVTQTLEKPLAARDEFQLVVDDQDSVSHVLANVQANVVPRHGES